MNTEIRKTNFTVDDERCIGCGKCVDACPMHILEVKDGCCLMVKEFMCLVCGTCLRECPVDAISIAGVGNPEQVMMNEEAKGKEAQGTTIHFVPILKKLTQLISEELHPLQVYQYQGMDITDLDNFDLEGETCYSRMYKTDKLEKISISSTNFFGQMRADVMVITPGPEYDFPFYVMDWDESEDHIFFICDLFPGDDPGRNGGYLEKYLYSRLEDLYQTYCMIPGLKNSVFHWVRAIQSPYIITGTVEKHPAGNVAHIFNCAVDYLKTWLTIYKEAQPRDPHSDYMKLIHERRKVIRNYYIENDPGGGAINKFLGEERARKAMAIIVP